jgi:hypothetical protein
MVDVHVMRCIVMVLQALTRAPCCAGVSCARASQSSHSNPIASCVFCLTATDPLRPFWDPLRSAYSEAMSMKLLSAGYEHLSEKDAWSIRPGGKCVLWPLLISAFAGRVKCDGAVSDERMNWQRDLGSGWKKCSDNDSLPSN